MPAAVSASRPKQVLLLCAAVFATAVVAGCDAQEDADRENGRALFIEKCGTCHALDEAATTADIGPDLDAAFADARASGMDNDTIEGVTQSQISNPREVDPELTDQYMPANLVTGQDAEDVSAYVASVAGVPGIEPPQAPGGPGGQVFANNGCGACHVFTAAESGGAVGPNLDETLEGQSPEDVREGIVDPEAEIAQGFPSGVMPQDYEAQIPPEDLDLLVDFLVENAGKGAQDGG
jgi:mono/diheme cytochrome c family protein